MHPFTQESPESVAQEMSVWTIEDYSFDAHCHNQVEIAIILDGGVTLRVNEHTYTLTTGDVAVCGSNDIHSYRDGHGKLLQIVLQPAVLLAPTGWPLRTHFACAKISDAEMSEEMRETVHKIIKMPHSSSMQTGSGAFLRMRGYLLALCGYLLDALPLEEPLTVQLNETKQLNRMRKAFAYIEDHYTESIGLPEVAEAADINRYALSRSFKDFAGMRLDAFINHKRLIKAEAMIKDSKNHKLNLTNIALDCGFGSVRNFNRVYRECHGCSPSEGRKIKDEHAEPSICPTAESERKEPCHDENSA